MPAAREADEMSHCAAPRQVVQHSWHSPDARVVLFRNRKNETVNRRQKTGATKHRTGLIGRKLPHQSTTTNPNPKTASNRLQLLPCWKWSF